MKVLFISREVGASGGCFVFTNLYRRLLQDATLDLEYVCFTAHSPTANHLYDGLDVQTVEVLIRNNKAAHIQGQIDAAVNFFKVNHQKYDRIIIDSWYMFLAAARTRVINSDKVFHLVQRDPVFTPEDDSKIWLAQLFELMPCIPAQRVIVGEALARFYNHRYSSGYPALNIYVDDGYRRGEFVVQDRDPLRFVVSSSHFNYSSKGLDFLMSSLREFVGRKFELTIICGDKVNLQKDDYNFPITITSAGTPKEMSDILVQQDVYISTATSESFGLALAEAVTLGMPAIALDSVGNRDFYTGDNFLFVKNPEDFLAGLGEICQIGVRRQLHTKARASMAKYTLDEMVRQFRSAVDI